MPPAGYPAFLQYLQSGRVRNAQALTQDMLTELEHTAPGTTLGAIPFNEL